MNILTEIIVLVASTLTSGQIDEYDFLPKMVDERTLPPDLQFMFTNKTDEELAFEECMKSYSLCMTFDRHRPYYERGLCAMSQKTNGKKTFESFCEMTYENCKLPDADWGFFHDGECVFEFADGIALF